MVINEEIVIRIKVSDEYITQAVKNLLSDEKIYGRKGEAYTAYV